MSKQKNLIISILIVVLVVAGGWFAYRMTGQDQNQSSSSDKVVATVNGEEINQSEFESRLEQAKQSSPTSTKQAELEQQVLDQMIARVVVEQKAKEEGTEVKDSAIQSQYDEMVKNSGGQEKFKQQLNKSNLTEKEFKKRLKNQILVSNYLESQIPKDEIEVTDEEIKSHYDKISANQKLPPLEKIKTQIKGQVVQQKRGEKVQGLVDSLREKAEIKTNL